MVPNITEGSGFGGLFSYLLVDLQTGQPRVEASIIGGSLVGRTVAELTKEMSLIRRLRPGVEQAVLHHSLSYAATEDPTDEQIIRDADRYLEHMGLSNFPHLKVVHRDKGCVHIHMPISRIGDDGSLADVGWHKFKSQKAAAFVELEFGLVQVERPKMRDRIDKEWAEHQRERPDIQQAEPQALARPELANQLGVMAQIRLRLESIPAGLSLPEWYKAADLEGVHLVPNMGTEKLTGWSVQLKGTESKPVALGKAFLSWNKLLETGRVIYNHDEHFAFALKCKEVKHDKPDVALKPAPPPATGPYPRDSRTLLWDWQPSVPTAFGQDLVGGLVGSRLRPGAFGRGIDTPTVAPLRRTIEVSSLGPRVGSDWPPLAHLASSFPGVVADLSKLRPAGWDAHRVPRSSEHLGGRGTFGGSQGGTGSTFGFNPARPGAHTGVHHYVSQATGPDLRWRIPGVAARGIPVEPGGGPGGSPRSSRIGICADRRSLEGLKLQEIVRKAIEPFREVLAKVNRILRDLVAAKPVGEGFNPFVELDRVRKEREERELEAAKALEKANRVLKGHVEDLESQVVVILTPEADPNKNKEQGGESGPQMGSGGGRFP